MFQNVVKARTEQFATFIAAYRRKFPPAVPGDAQAWENLRKLVQTDQGPWFVASKPRTQAPELTVTPAIFVPTDRSISPSSGPINNR